MPGAVIIAQLLGGLRIRMSRAHKHPRDWGAALEQLAGDARIPGIHL